MWPELNDESYFIHILAYILIYFLLYQSFICPGQCEFLDDIGVSLSEIMDMISLQSTEGANETSERPGRWRNMRETATTLWNITKSRNRPQTGVEILNARDLLNQGILWHCIPWNMFSCFSFSGPLRPFKVVNVDRRRKVGLAATSKRGLRKKIARSFNVSLWHVDKV